SAHGPQWPSARQPLPRGQKNRRNPRGNGKDGRPAPPLPRPAGANFQKTRRWRRPRPGTVGGGSGGGAGAPGPVAPPPLAAARAAHLPPAGRPHSGNAPQPGRGPRPAQLARAGTLGAAMGNTVHRTLPDSSPPARLLATRPCYGPGPERRAVLGEAPRFHAQAKGKNVRLDGHSRRATRRNSFCNGVTFTQRPIRLYEQVRLRLVAVRPGWSGALRFGFTAHDPSLMSAQDIPKYACPDLVTRPGYWAKALPENLALRDTVLAYWADRHGRVFYSVNDGEPVLFHCGVAVGGPLWALIDVYGITDEVQLLGTLQSSPETTTPSGSFSGSQDDSDSDMTFGVNQSSSASESSLVTAPSSPLSPPVSPVFSAPEPAGSRNGECTVCFDSEVDTVIYTCGHMCLCHSCGLRLRRQARACCPICRRPIKDVIKIYRP
ncbi:E3 ubiquitin-protein ligase NEURL1B, partial [Lemmus lemmus]